MYNNQSNKEVNKTEGGEMEITEEEMKELSSLKAACRASRELLKEMRTAKQWKEMERMMVKAWDLKGSKEDIHYQLGRITWDVIAVQYEEEAPHRVEEWEMSMLNTDTGERKYINAIAGHDWHKFWVLNWCHWTAERIKEIGDEHRRYFSELWRRGVRNFE